MKRLMVAALVAGTLFTLNAAETAVPATAVNTPVAEAKVAPAPVAKAPVGARRQPLTSEQRAKMREQREQFFAKRRAEMEARAIAVIKKYGLDDEKAKALYEELMQAIRPQRRPRTMVPAPAPKPAAEVKPAAEKKN